MTVHGIHQIPRNARDAQLPPEFPIENFVDSLTGERLRRVFIGRVWGGRLVLGLPTGSGISLLYHRVHGNPNRPKYSEMDSGLRRFIEQNWRQIYRKSGKPLLYRQGDTWLLTKMPCALWVTEHGPGWSVLFKYTPVIARPRGALVAPFCSRCYFCTRRNRPPAPGYGLGHRPPHWVSG